MPSDVERVVAIMKDYRYRRLKHLVNHPEQITKDEGPPELEREAEAAAILAALATHPSGEEAPKDWQRREHARISIIERIDEIARLHGCRVLGSSARLDWIEAQLDRPSGATCPRCGPLLACPKCGTTLSTRPSGEVRRALEIIETEKQLARNDDPGNIELYTLRLARIDTAEQILGARALAASEPPIAE